MKKNINHSSSKKRIFLFYFSNNAGACTYGLVFLSLCANFWKIWNRWVMIPNSKLPPTLEHKNWWAAKNKSFKFQPFKWSRDKTWHFNTSNIKLFIKFQTNSFIWCLTKIKRNTKILSVLSCWGRPLWSQGMLSISIYNLFSSSLSARRSSVQSGLIWFLVLWDLALWSHLATQKRKLSRLQFQLRAETPALDSSHRSRRRVWDSAELCPGPCCEQS